MKHITQIIAIIIIFANTSFALAGGDDIANTTNVTTSSFVAEITASNTANTMTATCFLAQYPDVYYSFTANATTVDVSYIASSITGGIDPRVQFLTFDGTNYVEIGCHTYIVPNPTATLSGLTLNEIVYMRLVDNGGNENGTVEFSLNGIVLPLDLLSFEGEGFNHRNILTWSAAQATNVDVAEVEVSSDGKNFEYLDAVPLKNGSAIEYYSWTHDRPTATLLYYRLKIIDLDGTFKNSKIISVENRSLELKISIFPNPTTDYISVSGMEEDDVAYVLRSDGVQLGIILPNQQLDVSHMPSGIYYIQIKKTIHKIVKQ